MHFEVLKREIIRRLDKLPLEKLPPMAICTLLSIAIHLLALMLIFSGCLLNDIVGPPVKISDQVRVCKKYFDDSDAYYACLCKELKSVCKE